MTLFDLAINFIEVFITCWFIISYFRLKDNYRFYHGIMFFLVLFTQLTAFNYFSTYSMLASTLFAVIIVLFTIIYAENPLVEKIFISIFITMISLFANVLTFAIYALIFNFNFAEIMLNYYFYVVITTKVLFALFSYLIIRLHRKIVIDLSVKQWVSFIVVALLSIIIELNLVEILINQQYHDNMIVMIIFFVASIVGIMYTVFIQVQVMLKKNYQEKVELLYLKTQKHLFLEIEESNQEIKKLKHDLKHQLMIIKGQIEHQDYAQAIQSIESYQQKSLAVAVKKYTGNSIIDYVIASKVTLAKKENISMYTVIDQLDFHLDLNDLGILLGNLLDNALENCTGDKKEISLFMKQRHDFLIIELANSIDQSILKTNRYLKSFKGINHGFGVFSIKKMVQKYQGTINFSEDADSFKASIVLKNSK